MEYRVVEEHTVVDAGWDNEISVGEYTLTPGQLLNDGDLEPDIMASLFYKGIIERADGIVWGYDPEEVAPEPVPDEEDE